MERTWKENGLYELSFDCLVVEKVLGWLEREDTEAERMVAYGLCLAAVAYFLAGIFHYIF